MNDETPPRAEATEPRTEAERRRAAPPPAPEGSRMPAEHWNCQFDIPHDGPCEPVPSEGAAPRAEGLRASTIASALADCPDLDDWTLHDRDRLATDLHAALARHSRPSDEKGTAREVCKRFRHDEHCIDELHA